MKKYLRLPILGLRKVGKIVWVRFKTSKKDGLCFEARRMRELKYKSYKAKMDYLGIKASKKDYLCKGFRIVCLPEQGNKCNILHFKVPLEAFFPKHLSFAPLLKRRPSLFIFMFIWISKRRTSMLMLMQFTVYLQISI